MSCDVTILRIDRIDDDHVDVTADAGSGPQRHRFEIVRTPWGVEGLLERTTPGGLLEHHLRGRVDVFRRIVALVLDAHERGLRPALPARIE